MNESSCYVGRDLTGRIVLVISQDGQEAVHPFTDPRAAAELSDRLSDHAQDRLANTLAYGGSHADQ